MPIANPPLIAPSGNFNDLLVNNLLALEGGSGGGTPGGSNTQIQFNNNGAFGGSSGLTWNGSTLTANNSILSGTNLGFFGSSATQQNLDYPSLEAVVELLQTYGLSLGPPWSQQGIKLVGTGNTGASSQGYSISLDSDGNTLAIGGSGDNSGIGAVWIFTRSSSTWTQQGTKLVGTGNTGASAQGTSVSLSSDGNTLAVGGPNDDTGVGATWIFIRSDSSWSQQGTKLVGTGNTGASAQGTSVFLSSDGNTLAIGGPNDDTGVGAAWIFTRSGTSWSQQETILIGTGNTGASAQGTSVSLSGDGNTLAIGGPDDDSSLGSAWIFTRSGTTWTQQGSNIVGTGNSGASTQGTSVSLNADDGNTLAIGGPGDNSSIGAVWIFTRSGSTWSQQGSKLVGIENTGASNQGYSTSLSSSGDNLLIGGPGNNSDQGAAWIYSRIDDQWSQHGFKLIGTGYTGASSQGYSVSLSKDGNYIAMGGNDDNSSIGASWIFTVR